MGNLLIEDREVVRWISFNRPAKLNAWLLDDIVAATDAVLQRPDGCRAIAFRGVGDRAFSAGVDVNTFLALTPATAHHFIASLGRFLQAVRTAPVPTLCAINGYCLGGAMELAMAADLRVAAENARFGMPEIKLGIPSVLDAALLSRHIGLARAKELLLTGDLYSAADLDHFGFLNDLVPLADLDAVAVRLLARLTGHSATAMAAQKRLFETWENSDLVAGIAASIEEFAATFSAAETIAVLEAYAAQLRAPSDNE